MSRDQLRNWQQDDMRLEEIRLKAVPEGTTQEGEVNFEMSVVLCK